MHVSYSELKAYWTCPAKYQFRKLETPTDADRDKRAFIGHLLMKVAETFYKEEWWRQPDIVYARARAAIPGFAATLTAKYGIDWAPEEEDEWLDVARMAVVTMIDTIKREGLLGVRNESELEATIGVCDGHGEVHTVHGRFDFLIIAKDGTVSLLDGKGGGKSYVDLDQLRLYSAMVPGRCGRLPNRVGWWFFRLGEVEWKTITEKARHKVLEKASTALTGIMDGNFAPTPSPKCALCDWRPKCEVGQRWLFAKAGDDDIDLPTGVGEISL